MVEKIDYPTYYGSADAVLKRARELILTRGNERDQPNGERAMKRCVATFNTMTGHNLTEVDGWLFMQYLKHSRSREGSFRIDDYEDDVSYSALKAEAAISTAAPKTSISELAKNTKDGE